MALEVKTVVQVLMQQQNRLFAYIWSIVGDSQLAEDAMQELSVLAVEKGPEVSDENMLVVWLRRAARLKALEARRKKSQLPVALEESVAEQLEAHWAQFDTTSDVNLVDILNHCVEQLTTHHREILRLRYVQGKKAGEIARALNRKAATVYQSIARLHRILRDCVDRQLREVRSRG